MGLIETLRRLQVDWEMDLSKLSLLAHVPEERLRQFLQLSPMDIDQLPTIPTGLENAMALASVYQKLKILLPEAAQQNEWLIKENSVLENQKPIEVLAMSPEHVAWVSYVLESSITNAFSSSV